MVSKYIGQSVDFAVKSVEWMQKRRLRKKGGYSLCFSLSWLDDPLWLVRGAASWTDRISPEQCSNTTDEASTVWSIKLYCWWSLFWSLVLLWNSVYGRRIRQPCRFSCWILSQSRCWRALMPFRTSFHVTKNQLATKQEQCGKQFSAVSQKSWWTNMIAMAAARDFLSCLG